MHLPRGTFCTSKSFVLMVLIAPSLKREGLYMLDDRVKCRELIDYSTLKS
jgi:hypothetical protein